MNEGRRGEEYRYLVGRPDSGSEGALLTNEARDGQIRVTRQPCRPPNFARFSGLSGTRGSTRSAVSCDW